MIKKETLVSWRQIELERISYVSAPMLQKFLKNKMIVVFFSKIIYYGNNQTPLSKTMVMISNSYLASFQF